MKGVYAIGDIVRGLMREHKAAEEGVTVIENILGNKCQVNYELLPIVVHSHPAVGSLGLSEEKLIKMGTNFCVFRGRSLPVAATPSLTHIIGREYKKGVFPMAANSKAFAISNSEGFVKILSDKKTDEILGIHMVSTVAEELIEQSVVAMQKHATARDLAKISYTHPTMAEAVKEAAAAASDKSIHLRYKAETSAATSGTCSPIKKE